MDGKVDDELIQYLLSIGALEFVFIDEEGEHIYRLTPEARELVPDLYDEHMQNFTSSVFSLWSKDLIDVVFDENGEPLIGINDNTENEQLVSELDNQDKNILKEILFVWKKKLEKEQWYNFIMEFSIFNPLEKYEEEDYATAEEPEFGEDI